MNLESNYFFSIENLRKENGISREDFCDGICSERQYWRYLNGSNLCPPDRITQFLKKLKITYSEFHYLFYLKEHEEYKLIDKLYEKIISGDSISARKDFEDINKRRFISYELVLFWDLCKLMYNIEFSDISNSEKVHRYKQAINYEVALNKEFINFYDLNILLRIAKLEPKTDSKEVLEFLYDICLTKRYYMSSNERYALPAIFLSIGKIFGSNGQIEKAMKIAKQGILYSNSNFDNKGLPNLYYLLALCEYKLGYRESFNTHVSKTLQACIVVGDTRKYSTFSQLIRKNFNLTNDQILNLINMSNSKFNKKSLV